MEINRESLEKTYVTCKSVNAAEKVRKVYESVGFKRLGKITKDKLIIGVLGNFVGPIEETLEALSIHAHVSKQPGLKGISYRGWDLKELSQEKLVPENKRKKFPRKMLVSYTGIKWIKETVYGKVSVNRQSFYVIYPTMPNGDGKALCWKYAKEIE